MNVEIGLQDLPKQVSLAINVDSIGDSVKTSNKDIEEIESAIEEVLSELEEHSADFARKFKDRLTLSLEGDIPESAVSDLIDHTPFVDDGDDT